MQTVDANVMKNRRRPGSAAHELVSDAYAVLSLAIVVALLIRHVML